MTKRRYVVSSTRITVNLWHAVHESGSGWHYAESVARIVRGPFASEEAAIEAARVEYPRKSGYVIKFLLPGGASNLEAALGVRRV